MIKQIINAGGLILLLAIRKVCLGEEASSSSVDSQERIPVVNAHGYQLESWERKRLEESKWRFSLDERFKLVSQFATQVGFANAFKYRQTAGNGFFPKRSAPGSPPIS